MRAAPKKPNGTKAINTADCPHADVCAAPLRQAEMMANVDQLGQSMGLVLENQEQLAARLTRVHDELLDHIKTVTDCNQFIVVTLRKLGGEDA
jgi:hypothetical protein